MFTRTKPRLHVRSHVYTYKAMFKCTKPRLHVRRPHLNLRSHVYTYETTFTRIKPRLHVRSHVYTYEATFTLDWWRLLCCCTDATRRLPIGTQCCRELPTTTKQNQVLSEPGYHSFVIGSPLSAAFDFEFFLSAINHIIIIAWESTAALCMCHMQTSY